MADSGVRVSNREIYDLVQKVDKTLDQYIATTDIRLQALERRADRGWSFWLAVLASPITGAALALWGFKNGGA